MLAGEVVPEVYAVAGCVAVAFDARVLLVETTARWEADWTNLIRRSGTRGALLNVTPEAEGSA